MNRRNFKVRRGNFKATFYCQHSDAWAIALLVASFLTGVIWGLAIYPMLFR